MSLAALPAEPPSWREVLRAQAGVLTRAQALAGGLSRDAWQWRVGRDWQLPARGVAVAHTGPLTQEQVLWTAVLLCGPGAALSGDWALRLAGLRVGTHGPVQVAVPAERRAVPRQLHVPGLELVTVRPRRVARLGPLVHPAAVPPRLHVAPAAVHSASWATSDRAAEWRLAAVAQQRLATPSAMRSVLVDLAVLPRRGLLLRVLDDVELGAHAQTELDVLALLRRHRLPLPDHLQLAVRSTGLRYLDGWWKRQRVALEVDGAHHREVAAWDADVLRANDLVVAARTDRILLLRLTAGNLRHDEAAVVRQLRQALL